MTTVNCMSYESASVKVVDWGNGRNTLSNLHSIDRRKGHARALLEMICQKADEADQTLILEARQYGHPIGPDNATLVAFYESLGFELVAPENKHYLYMERAPRMNYESYSET